MITQFFKPSSVEEAMEQKDRYRDKACWFGNGTMINNSSFEFDCDTAIALEKLKLTGIQDTGDDICVGACVTLQGLIDSDCIPEVLKQAAGHESSRHIRNMKTIGGDIGIGILHTHLIPCLVSLSARVKTCHAILLLEEYLSDNDDSLILEIILPKTDRLCQIKKVSLQAHSTTIFSIAVSMDKTCDPSKQVIIAFSGIKADGVRLVTLENNLGRGSINLEDTDQIEKAVADMIYPVTDISGTEEYKKYIAGVSVADCIKRCISSIGEIKK